MTTNHTPGPWKAEAIGKYRHLILAEDNTYLAEIQQAGTAIPSDANARLMAAAPDLASALRAILLQVIQGPVLERDAVITQARAALAIGSPE